MKATIPTFRPFCSSGEKRVASEWQAQLFQKCDVARIAT